MVLIGDSVHAYPPSGQGMTLAIMGAVTLADHIHLYKDNLEQAFEHYTQSHRNEAKGLDLLATSHKMPSIFLMIYFYALGGAPHL